jgi:IS605 OrfB family transposase
VQKVITGTIHQGDFDALKQIMRDQSSCRRYAYQRIHKDELSKANDVVKVCKPLYMDRLNQRYIQDAVLRAKAVRQDHCLFGGKKNWRKLLSGLITKDQWHETRDSELYSRGDRTKKGNPNIRVLRAPDGYKIRIGLSKPREFLTFKLYIPEKFRQDFDLHDECYDVRIKAKAGKFYVYIGLDIPDPTPIYGFSNGAVGIDTNPDGLAVVEVDRDGNMVRHQYLGSQRILFARSDKRRHDIEALAIQVVNQAVQDEKGLVIEDLKFNNKKPSKCREFNRMRHNFIYSQLLQSIERRALKDGVEVKKINPAFTSIAGILKYQDMYSLNRHTAAALVIARRGMGICENIRVRVTSGENERLNLAGRGFKIALTKKAYSYFRHLYRVLEMKSPAVTPPCLNST